MSVTVSQWFPDRIAVFETVVNTLVVVTVLYVLDGSITFAATAGVVFLFVDSSQYLRDSVTRDEVGLSDSHDGSAGLPKALLARLVEPVCLSDGSADGHWSPASHFSE